MVTRWPRSATTALTTFGALCCLLGALPPTAGAQSPVLTTAGEGQPPPVERAVAELRRLLDEQRTMLEQQARVIEAQGRNIAALRRRLDGAVEPTGTPEPAPSPTQLATTPTVTAAAQVQTSPDLPAGVVSAGDFPKSIRIPGTEAAFRIGGQGRLMMVHSLRPLGTDDRFVTSSIPVAGQQRSGEERRVNYSAAASRAHIDLRTEGARAPLRTFLESDFAGDERTLRLRHAFIQTQRWLGGQTWSTFSDPEAEPIGIDFEGLNAISMFRQPQLRYTRALRPNIDLSLALENPAPDLTGASGVNMVPDFIARVRWNATGVEGLLGRTAHVQTAILVRTLRGEVTGQPELTLSTGGAGLNVSGVLIPRWDRDDRVKFAANGGWGIGRYITDLGTLGGQDGVYDPLTETLSALRVSSAYFGYERMWKPSFSSTFTFGIVQVNNLDIQPSDALRRTQRATFNLTWYPVTDARLVLEFLGGTRINKDGASGTSSQIQAGWIYAF